MVYNARWSIERTLRDHALRVDAPRLKEASLQLRETLPRLAAETDPGSLRVWRARLPPSISAFWTI